MGTARGKQDIGEHRGNIGGMGQGETEQTGIVLNTQWRQTDLRKEGLPNSCEIDVYHHTTDMMTVQCWPLMLAESLAMLHEPLHLGVSYIDGP